MMNIYLFKSLYNSAAFLCVCVLGGGGGTNIMLNVVLFGNFILPCIICLGRVSEEPNITIV